jgi:hypothetical protein
VQPQPPRLGQPLQRPSLDSALQGQRPLQHHLHQPLGAWVGHLLPAQPLGLVGWVVAAPPPSPLQAALLLEVCVV